MTFTLNIRSAEQIAAEARAEAERAAAAAIDEMVEAKARALGYNSAAHLAGYVNSTVPEWAAEARAFVEWRDAIWLAAQALRGALAEDGAKVTPEVLDARLPSFRAT